MSIAIQDIVAGIQKWRVWVALAKEDIGDHHRRTAIGPLWLLLNYLAFVGTFIIVFGRGNGIPNYQSYVAIGLFVWLYLSEVISQGISLFVREESFIKGTTLPLSVYVMRMTMQSIIRASYTLIGCLAIVLLEGTPVSLGWIWGLLGLFIIFATTPAVITVTATAGAYLPDLQFIVSNIMRIGLFLTPIFWVTGTGDGFRNLMTEWNPFAYYLDLVRTPIIDGLLPVTSILVCTLMGIMFWLIALLLLGTFRKRIIFVL